MMDRPTGDSDPADSHAGPGWLAASGIACLLGRHWPEAALHTSRTNDTYSRCADCGSAMERQADGRWVEAERTRPPATGRAIRRTG